VTSLKAPISIAVDNTVDTHGNPWRPPQLFAHYHDGRNAYLYVSFRDLEQVGLSPNHFSEDSHLDAGGMYLAEVLDAEIFESAHKAEGGFRMVLVEVCEGASTMRSLQVNTQGAGTEAWRAWKDRRHPQPVR
jgi:hypothetical protein